MSHVGWYIGVGLGIGSSIVSNVGVNIQKLAHSHREKFVRDRTESHFQISTAGTMSNPDAERREIEMEDTKSPTIEETKAFEAAIKKEQKSYIFDFKWIFGLFLQIVGATMDFTALGFAPASVVAPLGSLTLVTNVCLAPIMHYERLSVKTMIATSLIISGTITTVIFSPRTVGVSSTEQVFNLFKSNAFISYAIPTSFILLITFGITRYMSYIKKNNQTKYSICNYKLHRFCVATLSGTMGAQNVFFAKCVSTLLVFTIEGNGKNMFLYWQTYLVIVGLLTTIYFQLKWLNLGLKHFSALHIVPVFQSFWITVSVIGGLTVYQEFNSMRIIDKIIFPLGVIVTIFGVALLTSQKKPKQKLRTENDSNNIENEQYDDNNYDETKHNDQNQNNQQNINNHIEMNSYS